MTDTAAGIPSRAGDRPDVGGTRRGVGEFDAALDRLGGVDHTDEPSHRQLRVPPSTRTVLAPLVAALRWCAVVLGTALAAPDAVDGSVGLVVTTSICLYLTTWRTLRPLRLGAREQSAQIAAVSDAVLLGVAIGMSGGLVSAFVACLIVAAGVASFGWGLRRGAIAAAAGVVATVVVGAATGHDLGLASASGWLVLVLMVTALLAASVARTRLADAEGRRRQIAGRLDALAETNELLHVLNRVARTLPSSLDLQQAVAATRAQLIDTFDASVLGLVMRSEVNRTWSPLLTEGLALAPTMAGDAALPQRLGDTVAADAPVLVRDLAGTGLDAASGSGIYTPLRTRGRVVGALGIEHPEVGRYSDRDLRLLAGLGDALALTIDNARWFRRLRILGAEEERARIARDLHDRLGQWLTYISFELERIKSSPTPGAAAELDALHADVQRAIDELRETLRQMRTSVTEEQSLAEIASDLAQRWARQSGVHVDVVATESDDRLPVAVENEVLRIMQEALNNIGKHANASRVVVDWRVTPAMARLRVADDGDGFDESRGVRETAFGLVGMRERAEVIDAELVVTSSPGAGTTIEVTVPREDTP
ncbi:MAG: histidine kinase [Acidimicrobiales bacterium]